MHNRFESAREPKPLHNAAITSTGTCTVIGLDWKPFLIKTYIPSISPPLYTPTIRNTETGRLHAVQRHHTWGYVRNKRVLTKDHALHYMHDNGTHDNGTHAAKS
jgi:hypothetical protein